MLLPQIAAGKTTIFARKAALDSRPGEIRIPGMKEWVVELPGDTVAKLRSSFELGPIYNDQGSHRLVEHTVGEFDGLKVEIFSNEHPPPHFRVKLGRESNSFRIADCSPLHGDGLKRYFRNITRWHHENKHTLIAFWNKTRPTECPVGEYRES